MEKYRHRPLTSDSVKTIKTAELNKNHKCSIYALNFPLRLIGKVLKFERKTLK